VARIWRPVTCTFKGRSHYARIRAHTRVRDVIELIDNYSKDVFSKINRTQAAAIDLDLQIRPREGPKTSCRVNLVQIRSAAPKIFHTQTKKSHTAPKQKLTRVR